MSKKRVLVVGGAGYIGSHMLLALAEDGFDVEVFDNLSRGHADAVGSAPLVTGDLCAEQDLERVFARGPFDLVMHFAALAYVGESVSAPESYYKNNVSGTLNLLSAMKRRRIQRIVFSSTCATYGEPEYIPIDERHPQRPLNPYGRTKLMIEQALQDYAQAYGLQSISLRYFNAAGADAAGRAGERHEPETHLIPLVLAEAMRLKQGGDPTETALRVFGNDFDTADGSCVRDYIHVTDLCSAHLAAARRLLEGNACGAEVFNLANGHGFSVLDVIEVCRKVTGQPIQWRTESRRPGDPAKLIGHSAHAAEVLGWTPALPDLTTIVESAWSWMNKSKG